MERFWRRTGVALGKHWVIVMLVLVAITGVLALGARQIDFATGQDSYLNPDSQIAIDNVEFQEQFGGETVILLFTATDPSVDISQLFEGENLATFERINAELSEIPEAFAVISPLTSLQFSDGLLAGGAGSSALISAAARDPDPAGVEARNADIQIALARLGATPNQVIGDPDYNELLIYGNDGFTLGDEGPVAPPDEERVIRLSLASTFPNPQTAVGGVVLQGNATLDEQSAGTEQVLEVLSGASFDGFELTVTGSPVYLKEINDYLQGGMLTLGAAALLVMAVILIVMFRVRWRLLPLLAVVFGVAWSFSLLGLIGIDLSLVTISGLPILIGVGIDFAIQVHNRVEEEVVLDKEAHPIGETLANLAPPLIAATVTGIVAFLALRISKVPMIRDFGVLLAVGVGVLVIVGMVVPATVLGAREWKKPTSERGASLVERIVVWLGGINTKFAPFLLAAAVALFVGGVLAEGQAEIESDPVRWIDQESQTVADIEQLEEATGFSTTLGILVQANNVYAQPVVDLIYDFTVAAEDRPEVVSSSSLVNTMGKIITIEGATLLPPTTDDVVNAVEVMPPDIQKALLPEGATSTQATSTQVNLRLGPASLAERAVLVEELEADLQRRIDELEVPADSILLTDLPEGQDPVRATPAGLATVGIGLLENLSANRAALTYLALSLAGLFLVLRFRSFTRALLALVPVFLAVGVSSLIVGFSGIALSPLTTVSGPLVIASCAEFSVLILGRYLEERQHGLSPREGSDRAAARTGRAFFTSAATTIGGFGVLIGSALPLLRDFGLMVTLNIAIALLAALVVMPPLMVWVDERGWIGTNEQILGANSVRLAAALPGSQTPLAVAGVVVFSAGAIGSYVAADTSTGETVETSYEDVPLPTTTTTTTTTTTLPPGTETTVPTGPAVDPSQFGTERPTSLVGGILFDVITEQGVEPNVANCTVETLFSRVSEDELLALGIAAFTPEALAPVNQAALDCGIDQPTIDAAIAAAQGG
jgi:predicted RND superfamily exporter protein